VKNEHSNIVNVDRDLHICAARDQTFECYGVMTLAGVCSGTSVPPGSVLSIPLKCISAISCF
jgi:hypothetical protein